MRVKSPRLCLSAVFGDNLGFSTSSVDEDGLPSPCVRVEAVSGQSKVLDDDFLGLIKAE